MPAFDAGVLVPSSMLPAANVDDVSLKDCVFNLLPAFVVLTTPRLLPPVEKYDGDRLSGEVFYTIPRLVRRFP